MKRLFFLLLYFVGLCAEDDSQFFMGFGGGYGINSKFYAKGPSLNIGGESNTFVEIDLLRFGGIMGYETRYSNDVSTRNYIDVGYSFTHTYGKQKDFMKNLLTTIDASWNHDAILNVPVSKNIQFRLYIGVGIGVNYYGGFWVDSIKGLRTALGKNDIAYERYDEDFIFFKFSYNFGTQLLLAQHHILEFAINAYTTFGTKPALLTFKLPKDEMVSTFEVQLPIVFLSRYVYRF